MKLTQKEKEILARRKKYFHITTRTSKDRLHPNEVEFAFYFSRGNSSVLSLTPGEMIKLRDKLNEVIK